MKRSISVIAILLILSLTACSIQKHHPEIQEMQAIRNLKELLGLMRENGQSMNILRDFPFQLAQLHGLCLIQTMEIAVSVFQA